MASTVARIAVQIGVIYGLGRIFEVIGTSSTSQDTESKSTSTQGANGTSRRGRGGPSDSS
eukprot:1330103-Amorphochlora_amoeboformis.AAC.1